MFRHRIHQGIARLGVFHKEGGHARWEGAEDALELLIQQEWDGMWPTLACLDSLSEEVITQKTFNKITPPETAPEFVDSRLTTLPIRTFCTLLENIWWPGFWDKGRFTSPAWVDHSLLTVIVLWLHTLINKYRKHQKNLKYVAGTYGCATNVL